MDNLPLVNAADRLKTLPPKVSNSFSRLLNMGHIDEPTLGTVLDAAELAGDWNKSLWFTSSYLFLRSKAVPVGDVIAMSKQLHRKVSLDWSAKRWTSEHDKLSRYASLKALSDANRQFEVSYFEKNIREIFPGYLIKTSRRLGMEGFRQKHCVASYEHKIVLGGTAIASIFVNKTRWTVELLKTTNPEHPIRVGQVKSKFNAVAPDDVRVTIHEYLGIAIPGETIEHMENNTLREQNLARIIPVLQQLHVRTVSVDFAGSGDDGHIHTVSLYPHTDENPLINFTTKNRDYVDGMWVWAHSDNQIPLREALKEVVYDYLEMTGVDWCNGAGGQGAFNIDLEQGVIDFEINTNFTETVTGYANEWTVQDILGNLNAPPHKPDE